ncbi:MAG: hypothetical protein ABJB12_01610 [Pseudomonadota bacterium]
MNDGAPPRPDPKAIRPSIVDAGWSMPPPRVASELPPPPAPPPQPAARPLPSYEAHEAAVREVTMVDREIQTRAQAMREKDTLPPPRRASAFPPAPPPPSVVRNPDVLASPLPVGSRPPPPLSRPRQSVPPVQPIPAALPASPAQPSAAPPARPSIPPTRAVPALDGHVHDLAAERSAATLVRPRLSPTPPPLPSFAAALAQRVRFAGGEVPLWSLVTPLVLLMALGTAFAAAAITSAADPNAAKPTLKASAEPSASAAPLPPLPVPSLTPTTEEKPKALSVLERAALGDDAAVKELSAKPVADLRVEEAISLSLGQSAQDVRAARALRDRVEHDPGLIKDQDVLTQLRRYAEDPETARDALAAMANVPGPISADLIYEVWTATTSRTPATDLARALIYTKEVRAKASPALAVALDLREATTCEKTRDLLDRTSADGDRRAFHLLGKLTRKYGCGANKRADCYACLRSGTDLDAVMKATKSRREPRPFGG